MCWFRPATLDQLLALKDRFPHYSEKGKPQYRIVVGNSEIGEYTHLYMYTYIYTCTFIFFMCILYMYIYVYDYCKFNLFFIIKYTHVHVGNAHYIHEQSCTYIEYHNVQMKEIEMKKKERV